ncbi:hypothetical protein CQW23_00589 [Capsicum baccatum]|uniref:Uncharacterized protein n=1 Tax=Capsicum baccatum TaxID=33114 RepID=A0A2G2XL64_CAPBA|nr:hypothetical protein CQW23_00589 [Capsicum baccatum]
MASHILGNTKNGERSDAYLEEREKAEKMKGLEHGSDKVNVGSLEREIEELMKFLFLWKNERLLKRTMFCRFLPFCSIRLWELSGQVLLEMIGHTAIVYSVDAHASGLIIGEDGPDDGISRPLLDGIQYDHGCAYTPGQPSKPAAPTAKPTFKHVPKFVYNNIQPTHEEVQSLDLQMIEGFELNDDEYEFSPETIAGRSEILKKTGFLSDASASQHTKRRRTVRFDFAIIEEQVYQKTPSSVSTRIVSTQKTPSSDSKRVHAEKTTPSSSSKSVRHDNSDETWDEMKLFFQSYIIGETVKSIDIDFGDDPMDGHYFDWNRSSIQKRSEDVEGCCEDIRTARLDALVKFVVNQNSTNPNVGTPSTVHINKDQMGVEGISADIGPATLESLVTVVENLKPDSANVGTSTMEVNSGIELDVILKGIAAPVDDLPIEVVPPSEAIVNKHDISDSQLPPDFPDAIVAAHQAAKTPAKRTRTRSKVFMSPYTTEYASGSKAIEDQIEESKKKFVFYSFLISDNMPRGVIEEYKQWVEEGLLKFHTKKDRGVFVARYAEYLSEGMNVPSDGFEAEYHRMRYTTLL